MLRIGYVPEHFCSPLLQLAEKHPSTVTLVPCPEGTGQMTAALNNNSIDVAIALTESLIASIANRSKEQPSAASPSSFKLVGKYVTTPLRWAVIAGAHSPLSNLDDLSHSTLPIGISRYGSGSHVMASYLAFKHNWSHQPSFKKNNSFQNLRDSVNATAPQDTSVFLWEWYTTKPFVDSGEVKFIGDCPTPWPSWLIAANPLAPPEQENLHFFLNKLSTFVQDFNSDEARAGRNIEFIKEKFNYTEQDIKDWLKTVAYPDNVAVLESSLILDTLDVLEKAGVVKKPSQGWDVADFINTQIATVS